MKKLGAKHSKSLWCGARFRYEGRMLEDHELLVKLGKQLELQVLHHLPQVDFVERDERFEGCKACSMVMLGQNMVGKSSIIRRCYEDDFDERYLNAIGLDFRKFHLLVDQVPLCLMLYDSPAGASAELHHIQDISLYNIV